MTVDLSRIPVVILAGGQGARFDHESQVTPKPMIEVAGRPILQHIIDLFTAQGFREFIILTGYMSEKIESHLEIYGPLVRPWTWKCDSVGREVIVRVCHTGYDSHTGLRLWNAKEVIGKRRFVLTYGDGLSDVDMFSVVNQHVTTGAGVTMTAVRPPGRFGVVEFDHDESGSVLDFCEKAHSGWINGGFMVMEPEFIEQFIEGEFELESTALRELAACGGLYAYKHYGYWQCMDTRRDRDQINEDVRRIGHLPWMR